MCVDGYTGVNAIFNTAGLVVPMGRVGANTFTYEEAGLKRYELQFSTNANGIQQASGRTYSWDGAVWVLAFSVTVSVGGFTPCFSTGTDGGVGNYTYAAVGNFVKATTISVTFAGITMVIAPDDCNNNWHLSGILNGVTYSGVVTGPSNPAGSCGVSESDFDVRSKLDAIFTGVARIAVGVRSDGVRGWKVTVLSSTFGATSVFYFVGNIALNDLSCKGTFVADNEITAKCQTHGGVDSIGYGGTATVILS